MFLCWKLDVWVLVMCVYFESVDEVYFSENDIEVILVIYDVDIFVINVWLCSVDVECGLLLCFGKFV